MEEINSTQREQEDDYCTLDQSQDNMEDKEALDCPVCLEPYNEGLHMPKMMPCLHTLCASCIASLTSAVIKQKSDSQTTDSIPTTAPETRLRRTFVRFASQPNLSTGFSEGTDQGATPNTITTITDSRNHTVNTLANVLQTNRQHPVLRRLAGRGPSSPTTRQPQDPLPPTPTTTPVPFTRPPTARKPRGGLSVSLKRPEVSPPLPPKPEVISPNTEPQIPKDVVVQCPLCRSEVSTSKLQTNRYVLAHMRDLARLSIYSPTIEKPASATQPSSPPFPPPEDFWCEDCKQTSSSTCINHQLMPIAEWVETQKATVESLQMVVEDQVAQNTAYLQSLEEKIKDIYHSLNKASRFVWQARKQVEDIKEELKHQPPIPDTESQKEMAEVLTGKVTQLERLAKRASKAELSWGNSEVVVGYKDLEQQLFITTQNPDTSLIITVVDNHTTV